MGYFTTEQIDTWVEDLEDGKIKPDHFVDAEYGEQSLLHAVLNSEHSHQSKFNRIKKLIELGCDVDMYSSVLTPIGWAAQGVANGPNNIDIVKFMLKSHEKGHRSDLNILEAASGSLDKLMFRNVVRSGKIDSNVTQMKGSHILHHLADVEGYDTHISDLFKYLPDTNPNPIHRKGYSPLTHALNNGIVLNSHELANNGGKIIGKLTDPKFAVDLEMIHLYDGDFFEDFPEIISYIMEVGKDHLLPETVKDLFIF
jgi:hypothetical protein